MKIALLIIAAIIFLAPLAIMVSGSFQPLKFVLAMPPRMIPWDATLENYILLLKGTEVLRWLTNTMIVVASTVCGAVCISAMAGYAFSVYSFRGSTILLGFLLSLIVIPAQVLIIPTYVVIRHIGLRNTFAAASLPRILSVMGVMLFRAYISHIPRDLIEAGRAEGAGEWRIMIRLIMPQCSPIIGLVALMYGIQSFQDYLWQLLVLQRTRMQTLIVGLVVHLRQLEITNNAMGMSLAMGVFMFAPLFCVYLATNKLFTRGLSLEGVRG